MVACVGVFNRTSKGLLLIDTDWHREISPKGEYDRIAQVKHLGVGHFLINQGVLPIGQSVTEQLEELGITLKNIDYVIMTHLHTDHASGLRQLKDAKKILVSRDELQDTKKISNPLCKKYVGRH